MTLHTALVPDRSGQPRTENAQWTRHDCWPAIEPDGVAGISLRQLRLFESIWRLKTISKASEECSLSQPAVSQALAKLETQLGVHLFNRSGQVSLSTEYGEKLYIRTVRLFAQLEQAILEFGAASSNCEAAIVARRISRPQLRALSGMLRSGSFEQAGREFGRCHTAMYRAARDLECNLARRLLSKTALGWTPTPEAQRFSSRASVALAEIERAAEEICSVNRSPVGRLIIGAMPSGGVALLNAVIDRFLATYPGVQATIIVEGAAELKEQLRTGGVDVVLGLLPCHACKDFSARSFATTPYLVAGRKDHPLAARNTADLAALASFGWVVGAEGSSRREAFDRLFDSASTPAARICTSALPAIRQLLEKSDRLALMTSFELFRERSLTAISTSPVGIDPSIGMISRANWLPTPVQQGFVDILEEGAAKALGRPRSSFATASGRLH